MSGRNERGKGEWEKKGDRRGGRGEWRGKREMKEWK